MKSSTLYQFIMLSLVLSLGACTQQDVKPANTSPVPLNTPTQSTEQQTPQATEKTEPTVSPEEKALTDYLTQLERELNQHSQNAADFLLQQIDRQGFMAAQSKSKLSPLPASLNTALLLDILQSFAGNEPEFRFSHIKDFKSTDYVILKIRAFHDKGHKNKRIYFYGIALQLKNNQYKWLDVMSFRHAQSLSAQYQLEQFVMEYPHGNAQTITQGMALSKFLRAQRSGEDVLRTYNALSDTLKHHPAVISKLLSDAMLYDTPHLEASLRLLEPSLKSDPHYAYTFANMHYALDHYSTAMSYLDQFTDAFDQDSYIETIKSAVAQDMQQDDQALFHLEKAISIDANDEEPYNMLLEYFIKRNAFEDAILVVDVLTDYFGYDFLKPDLSQDDFYGPLVKSEAFIQWKQKKLATPPSAS